MKPRYFLYIAVFLLLSLITACGGNGGSDSDDTADATPPNITARISPPANSHGWHNSNVTVSFECNDADSGIATCPADVTINTEGAGQVIRATATDKAGNTASAQASLNVDKTPVDITASTTPSSNPAGWFNQDVTISFTCTDNLSGVDSCPEIIVLATDGANQVISAAARDIAGNDSSLDLSLNIDKTAPGISASTSPAPNAAGWFNSDVNVEFECVDPLSGVNTCSDSIVVTSEGTVQIVSGSVTDLAGNAASVDMQLDIDKTAPGLTIDSPAQEQRVFGFLPPVTVAGEVNEILSGIDSLTCNGEAAMENAGNFECDVNVADGANTITVTATDTAGNIASVDRNFTYLEPELELAFIDSHELIWSTYGADPYSHASYFRPITPDGFHLLGHFGYQTLVNDANGYALAVREVNPGSGALVSPTDFTIMWDTVNGGLGTTVWGAFWKPNAPAGYTCLGMVIQTALDIYAPPDTSSIKCVRNDLVISFEEGNYDTHVLLATGTDPDDVTIPFVSKMILPKKSHFSAQHAIYPGTFNGSSYSTIFQDVDLMHWLNGEKVLHTQMPAADIEPAIEQYGPLVWLHPLEVYFLDKPENILNISELNKANVAYESNFDLFSVTNHSSMATNASDFDDHFNAFIVDDIRYGTDITFKWWISYDPALATGDLEAAKAYINVLPVDAIFTDIQFWFYYPYNGPGRISPIISGITISDNQLARIGRHYGDWEHVTLRMLNQSGEMDGHELIAVYMSRHSQGQWFSRNYFGSQLGFDGTHPIVYSGKYSHAFYPQAHEKIIYQRNIRALAALVIDFWDQTGLGYAFAAYTDDNYQIINSTMTGTNVTDKNWLDFNGRWGGYELLSESFTDFYTYTEVGAGPYGPSHKFDWKYGDPFDWFWTIKVEIE